MLRRGSKVAAAAAGGGLTALFAHSRYTHWNASYTPLEIPADSLLARFSGRDVEGAHPVAVCCGVPVHHLPTLGIPVQARGLIHLTAATNRSNLSELRNVDLIFAYHGHASLSVHAHLYPAPVAAAIATAVSAAATATAVANAVANAVSATASATLSAVFATVLVADATTTSHHRQLPPHPYTPHHHHHLRHHQHHRHHQLPPPPPPPRTAPFPSYVRVQAGGSNYARLDGAALHAALNRLHSAYACVVGAEACSSQAVSVDTGFGLERLVDGSARDTVWLAGEARTPREEGRGRFRVSFNSGPVCARRCKLCAQGGWRSARLEWDI
eukprot:6195091-Pleurochrysis_carterae.AAC.2